MKPPFILGLTGSIGMGKSSTAQIFANLGVPVWDADATVHQLYAAGGQAAQKIGLLFPDVLQNGAVHRPTLRARIAQDSDILPKINAIVHPLVAQSRANFIAHQSAPVVVLDVPLLFETGADALCDAVAVVSVPADEQRRRVLGRGQMSEPEFDLILSRQMPDAQKRAMARWVIETTTPDHAARQVRQILSEISHA